MNLALFLTVARIFVIPLFFVAYLYYPQLCPLFGVSERAIPFILIALFALCELSDLLDGFVARKRGEVTSLGKVLDPMADSIVRISTLFCFTQGIVQLPLPLVLIFFYRDGIVSTLRTVCALQGVALAARPTGKIKAVVQVSAIFVILLMMIPYMYGVIELELLQRVSFYTVALAALYTFLSGVEYLYAHRRQIQQAIAK